jgi:hypothetical protein
MDPKQQPPPKERANREDRTPAARPSRPRRSGEGADSALANLKTIERDRARTIPADDTPPRR